MALQVDSVEQNASDCPDECDVCQSETLTSVSQRNQSTSGIPEFSVKLIFSAVVNCSGHIDVTSTGAGTASWTEVSCDARLARGREFSRKIHESEMREKSAWRGLKYIENRKPGPSAQAVQLPEPLARNRIRSKGEHYGVGVCPKCFCKNL